MSRPNGVVNFIRDAASTGAVNVPDAELVQRFASGGDEQAFRAIVARYGPIVWSVCRRVTGDHHLAEDAFQATLLVFARKAGALRAGAAVGGWLHAVAYRVALRARSAPRAESSGTEPADGPPGGALDELTVREAETALHDELARLPEKYRVPLVLCCLDGLSRDEAATRLGWSVNRVKHGLEQGRELLRVRLARRGIVLGVPLLTGALAAPASAVPPPLTEATVRHATGAIAPPAAIHSLANGVTRTMWVANWKWAVAGCAALVLTGGALAAILRPAPEAPPAPTAGPLFARAPAPVPEPKKEPPKLAWEVAAEYLSFITSGRPDAALKLGDNLERHVKEIQTSGLGSAKVAMILVNDSRVMVVTNRAKLKRQPNAEPTDEHVTVTLERKDATSPWRVIESDIADEKKVLRESQNYLANKFQFPRAVAPKEAPNQPKPSWNVAIEFLALAQAEKVAEALKLTPPGTISEKKIGEVTVYGGICATPTAILLNDTRVDVAFEHLEVAEHVVLMLTKSKDGAWQVKDIDMRDPKRLEDRVRLYLGGNYDEKPAKK